MHSIKLSDEIQNQVLIPLGAIYYPNDDQAVYKGEIFGDKKIIKSVHFKTCSKIEEGLEVQELPYYGWTLEKLHRFGSNYENFLYAHDKGCGINKEYKKELKKLSKKIRYKRLAELATHKFCKLFNSINKGWDPRIMDREIIFFRLFNRKFTILEGRHRIAILIYKYRNSGSVEFKTDQRNVRKDYYWVKLKNTIKNLFYA